MHRILLTLAIALGLSAADGPNFAYNKKAPFDIRVLSETEHDGVTVKDISFAGASGGRTGAYLVEPLVQLRGPYPGILYVHWYEPRAKNSNRTQFVDEAVTMARRGARSLIVETMWSDPQWFDKRDRKNDLASSVQQIIELRRALDVLMAQSEIDRKHIAYVGHDFGAMYGAVLAGLESGRVAAWALQAGTTSFSDWFLLGKPELEGETRRKFVEQLAVLDPVKYIGLASPSPVLLQFGKNDPYVPDAKAKAMMDAAGEPKQMYRYDGGHALDDKAISQRVEWLTESLRLMRQH
ncbi:MAG: hypothetical protein ABI693_20625 [Bryobacteraceae bacterium]